MDGPVIGWNGEEIMGPAWNDPPTAEDLWLAHRNTCEECATGQGWCERGQDLQMKARP